MAMAIKDTQYTGKPKENEEAFVPLFLRISIWSSRAMCASPAKLWRTSGRWWLGVSPPLITLQRLMVVIVNILSISAYTCDFLSEKQYRVRVGQTTLPGVSCSIEACLIVLSYSIGVLTGSRRLKHSIFTLQEIYKIKASIKRRNITSKYIAVKHIFFILFITWEIICYFILFCAIEIYQTLEKNLLVGSLYTIVGFQYAAIAFLQLEWSTTLVEISSTLKLVNDELEYLLKNIATTPLFRNVNTEVHRLSLTYDAICEILRQMDRNEPFILSYFHLISWHSLKNSYNLVAVLRTREFWHIFGYTATQINWVLLHFSQLVTMVEPCHGLQEQKERTGHLLSGLACQVGRRLDHVLLLSFIQQTQMSFPLRPCGVFTFTRPLLASFIGAISTYLFIIVQFQGVSEIN